MAARVAQVSAVFMKVFKGVSYFGAQGFNRCLA